MTTRATIRNARIHLGFAFYLLVSCFLGLNVLLSAFLWWADFQAQIAWGWKLLWPTLGIGVLYPGLIWIAYTVFQEGWLPELEKVQRMAEEVRAAQVMEERRLAELARSGLEAGPSYIKPKPKLPRGLLDANPDYDYEH